MLPVSKFGNMLLNMNNDNKGNFPPLITCIREREFRNYSDEQRAAVIYGYLVEGRSFRNLDEYYLNLTSSSKGYQSMGICHYLGLTKEHKGFFKGWKPCDIFSFMMKYIVNPDYYLVTHYIIERLNTFSSFSKEEESEIELINEFYPEEEAKGKVFIKNVLLKEYESDLQINKSLLSLPSSIANKEAQFITRNGVVCYIRNSVLRESVKSLYNYRCQVCGDVVLRTGWRQGLDRINEWGYLSADVHHIQPLSKGGEDCRENTLCLCPTCHRKFHSGEFRLVGSSEKAIVNDELLGTKKELNQLHSIQIS